MGFKLDSHDAIGMCESCICIWLEYNRYESYIWHSDEDYLCYVRCLFAG